jgi:crotonobetainyl-CoA:carnitine CoA-transferase CaiB-like acyl-CoA transferase
MQALEGIKVLDFCRNTPGMFCTMILGDLGAEVLMLERPMTGDRVAYERVVNHIDSPEDEMKHAAYNSLRRNKRSMGLNLKEPEALEMFYHLAQNTDIVIEGFRPGVMERLGVGYRKVQEINPRVVYCSISGYGQDGPYKNLAGHDINYISLAGALGLIGPSEEQKPSIPLNLMADYAGGGLCAAVTILAALMARERTGRGQYLDIAMTDGVLYMLEGVISNMLAWNRSPQRGGSMLNGAAPYYNVYETSDGKFLSVAAIEPWFWENLCRIMGREDLVPEQRARGRQRQEILGFLQDTFRTRTRDEWFELLRDQNISVGKVYSVEEALADPQVAHRGMMVEVDAPGLPDGKVSQVGIPMRMSETPGQVRFVGSVTGRHTDEVLFGMGYTREQVQDLKNREVVQ